MVNEELIKRCVYGIRRWFSSRLLLHTLMLQFSLIKPYHVIIATFINYLAGTHITLQQSFIQLKTMTNRGD